MDSSGRLRERLNQPGDEDGDDWAYETVHLNNDEFSYALGSGGLTRKKLARAADCILEYVGSVAVVAGFKDERKRGRDYLQWLLTQRKGVVIVDTRRREDVTVVEIPREAVGFVTGHKGEGLRAVEAQTGTFCFTDGDRGGQGRSNPGFETVLVFGASKAVRERPNLLPVAFHLFSSLLRCVLVRPALWLACHRACMHALPAVRTDRTCIV